MLKLTGSVEAEAQKWMALAGKIAEKALCVKAKCGAVIVRNEEGIGQGYNAPPLDDLNRRTCLDPNFANDSCVHAEWRAITDALRNNADKLPGSSLYFTRVNHKGEIVRSGKPYCTVCSRLALDAGISKFILWHDEGIFEYTADEYNKMSYEGSA